MWRLMASLLVLALVSASPQGYNYQTPDNGYLPPSPSKPSCVVAPITSVLYDSRVQTSVSVLTVNQVDTQYRTTTVVRQHVVPTTLYSTRVETQSQIQTSIVQQTSIRYNDRVVSTTISSPPIQRTKYVTITRVVPHVSYVTRTQIQTQVVPVEVVRTQVKTVHKPITNYQTKLRQETRVVSIPGNTVVKTRVQTLVQTSIIRSQDSGTTRFVTQTQVQQKVTTRYVEGEEVLRTSYVQRQQVIPYTSVNTRYENDYVTSERVVTRTNYVTQTQVKTQLIPREVVSTRIVENTIYSTRYETRVQTFTQIQTVVRTQYITPVPVVQTREVISTSIVQVPGVTQVVRREVVQTQQRQDIVYKTVYQPQQITVTRTVTGTCSEPGYNYDAPAVPFNYGK